MQIIINLQLFFFLSKGKGRRGSVVEHAAAGASGSVASLIQAMRNEIRKNGKRNRRGCLLFRIFFDASIVHTHTSGKDR